jgi:hypothetical protein
MKKGKSPFCAKIGSHVFNAEIQGGSSISMNYQVFYSKSETLFVLSSITKNGKIESAFRPLIDFGD